MGNCQAADSATVIIQHHGGRVERLYWPVSANEVMKSNPGHYVALVTLCHPEDDRKENNGVRFTRVKLLRPKDMLLLGQVYRLVTAQEVMKGLWAKKYARESRMKKQTQETVKKLEKMREDQSLECVTEARTEKEMDQVKQDRHRPKATQSAPRSSRHWRPSLQSISEAGS